MTAGLVISPLFTILSPAEFPPNAVLATLKTLNAIADGLSLEDSPPDQGEDSLYKLLYTEQHLANLTHVLSQSSPSLPVQQQISFSAALITKTCREEGHRKRLAQAGALEALAARLSSFAVATGCCFVEEDSGLTITGNLQAATARSRLAPILEAIGTIIKDSKDRASQFLSAPALAVFIKRSIDPASGYERKSHLLQSSFSNSFVNRQASQHPIDMLLPQIPHFYYRTPQITNHPPLGALGVTTKMPQLSRTVSSAVEGYQCQRQASESANDDENPIIGWLIYICRAENGITRLMAAWVLAILYRFGLANRRRETGFALLLIPLLVRMLDKDVRVSGEAASPYDACKLRSPHWIIKEQAPAVLALLAGDSPELQRAAVEAGAIKKLSQLLKESYDPLPINSLASLWTPQHSDLEDTESNASATRLGAPGLPAVAYHATRTRESVLVALAAIASLRDEHRKSIIDNGVVPFVIESLKPFNASLAGTSIPQPLKDDSPKNNKTLGGNPSFVILAACGTARALSRSVSTLRTSLMDAGLADPLFVLLRNQNTDIQVAATAVICNLVLEFSPMREVGISASKSLAYFTNSSSKKIIDAGILKILCEHAHSTKPSLRLNSIWALKHLVLTASNSLKITCLDELGPAYLRQVILNDSEDFSSAQVFRGDKDAAYGTSISMGTPNAAGEQVDLLNAVEDDDDGEEDLRMDDSIGALSRSVNDRKQPLSFSRPGTSRSGMPSAWDMLRDAHFRETEAKSCLTSRPDDVAIQIQGLDFLRNIICGPGAPDMIEHLFRVMGQDKVFDMLAAKIRPRVIPSFNRERRLAENGVKQYVPPSELLISVCYILVHIAAGHPKHRQSLTSHTELLKLLLPLFSYSHREVRVSLVWMVINLTCIDDQTDQPNCRIRAKDLMKVGIYEKLEAMESDPDLDVRERTKAAITAMSHLLR